MQSLLDRCVQSALVSFANDTLTGSWLGRREREAVSQFVFGHLLKEVSPHGFIQDPAQIGIEFPVPQVNCDDSACDRRFKRQVCKDIVIWREPAMTCWDVNGFPNIAPAAILEWKFGASKAHESDIEWLRQFTVKFPQTIGYAITANRPGSNFLIDCIRVNDGLVDRSWLRV